MKEYSLIKRRNKFIAIIIVFFMVVAILPTTIYAKDEHMHSFDDNGGCVCGAYGNIHSQDHSGWIPLKQEDFNPNSSKYFNPEISTFVFDKRENGEEAKNYYLVEDITFNVGTYETVYGICFHELYDGIEKVDTVNLCLNGYMFNVVRENGEGNNIFQLFNGANLNIFDCQETPHYFTDPDGDGYFERYISDYNLAGKTEGIDYFVTYGGGFTSNNSNIHSFFCLSGEDTTLNIYGSSFVGNEYLNKIFYSYDSDEKYINLYGTNICNNYIYGYDDFEVIFDIENCTNIKLYSCNIYNNYCKRVLDAYDDQIKVLLSDTAICNNIISYVEGYSNAFAILCTDETELTLSGNTIVKDNLCDGLQRNIFCCEDDMAYTFPFIADNLTSGSNSIGISNFREIKMSEQEKVCLQGADCIDIFFSDDPLYYICADDTDIYLKNRINEQPSADNDYKFDLYTNDLDSCSFQWYSGEMKVTELTKDNTLPALDGELYDEGENPVVYKDGVWEPVTTEGDEMALFFDFVAKKNQIFKCDVDYGDTKLKDAAFNFVIMKYETEEMYFDSFTESGKASFNITNEGQYTVGGCFGDDGYTPPNIKNTRLEEFNIKEEIKGQSTDTLIDADEGVYICKAAVKDSIGMSKIISSDVFQIEGPGYKIIEKPDIINIDTTSDCLFISNAPFNLFLRVEINGSTLNEDSYDCVNVDGSTKIVLHSSYLKSLKVGEYTLKIVSQDGNASAKFTITKNSKPSSGGGTTSYSIPKTGIK